jgi:hypothetical protein
MGRKRRPRLTLIAVTFAAGCARLNYGNEPPPDREFHPTAVVGTISMSPPTVTVKVNETGRVIATLTGPIARFTHHAWSSPSPVLEVTPRACTELQNLTRRCAADITGRAPGQTLVLFTAGVDRPESSDVLGRTVVTVVP